MLFFTCIGTVSTAQAWQVTLTWDRNDPVPDGYRVYMRQEGQDFDFSNPNWQGETNTCTITENGGQTDYYFVVRAFVADDESGDSNEVKYTPPTSTQTPVAGSVPDQTTDSNPDSGNDGATDVDETNVSNTEPASADADPNDAGSTPGSSSQAVSLWIEAEDGDIHAPMAIDDNAQASGELAIWTPAGSGRYGTYSSDAGRAVYSFDVPVDGSYVIWGRVIAKDLASDSFHISIDGSTHMVWHTIMGGQGNWIWDVISERNPADSATFDTTTPNVYHLSAGTHTIEFAQRESEAMLDRILITNDLNHVPENTGPTDTDSEGDYSNDGQIIPDTDSDGDHSDDGQVTPDTDSDDNYSDDVQVTPDNNSDDTVSAGQEDSIWIEAEDGDIYSPMVITANARASNASCIASPDGNDNFWPRSSSDGRAVYTFDVRENGSYVIWGRIIANDNRSDSIFVSVDGEPHMIWYTKQSEEDTWTWDVIAKRRFWETSGSANPEVYQFDAGTHTIEFVQRESGMMLDSILITKDLGLIPGS